MPNREVPAIPADDEELGVVLTAAVHDAVGRWAMPGRIVHFLTPLLPYLNSGALQNFDETLTEALTVSKSGVPKPDEALWKTFLKDVRTERTARGETPYVSWHDRRTKISFTDVSE